MSTLYPRLERHLSSRRINKDTRSHPQLLSNLLSSPSILPYFSPYRVFVFPRAHYPPTGVQGMFWRVGSRIITRRRLATVLVSGPVNQGNGGERRRGGVTRGRGPRVSLIHPPRLPGEKSIYGTATHMKEKFQEGRGRDSFRGRVQ